ncbi:MAG: TonB-dependent siderophore receptor [Kiritimatiellia bacterium]|jgi:outer membrane receptor protein involved in Fe transport
MKKTCLLLALSPWLATAQTNEYDLGRIVVEGAPVSKYRVDAVSTSTLFGAPPEELPVSVDVLTEDFIREQNPADLHDLLFFQPGVSGGGKSMMDRTSGQYTIRGKAGSSPTFDGTLPLTAAMGMFLDPNALERVEIAKGPVGSVQGGQTSMLGPYGAGGAVNLVPKQPRPGAAFTDVGLRASAGRDAQKLRFTVDANETASESLAVRVPASVDFAKPFWLPSGHDGRQSVFVAPSLLWEASDEFRMGLNLMLQHADMPGYQGVPSYRGKPLAPYGWDGFVAGDNDLRDTYTGVSAQGFAEWDATDVWQFRLGAGYAGSDMAYEHLGSSPYANQPGVPQVRTFDLNAADQRSDVYNLNGRATASFDAFGASHVALVQADATRLETRGESAAAVLDSPADYARPSRWDAVDTDLDRYGVLAQEYAEVGMLRLLAGARYDAHESDLGNTGDAVSPRAGVALVPAAWLTFFGNVSRTEAPNFGHKKNATEELTSSWRADQWEAGVRVSPVETFWITLAYYEIRQVDTPTLDDATGFYVTEGESENRGVEISLAGNFARNWSIYLGYAFNDHVEEPGEASFDSQPPHSLTLQTLYRIAEGKLRDVAFGLGYRFRDGYDGTMRGEYVGPDYEFDAAHVFDASMDVPLSTFGGSADWTVQFAVKNVFDEAYFASNRHYYQCFTGDPRMFEIALRGRF